MTDSLNSGGLYGETPQGGPSPEAVGPSLMDQVIGVFTDPKALFQRLHATPVWKGAFTISLLLSLAMTFIWGLKVDVDAMLRPILEQNPKIAPEQIDSIIALQSKFIIPGGLVMVVVFMSLGTLFFAWLYWLIGKFTAETVYPRFVQALSATVVSNLVGLPKLLLLILMCLVKPINGLTPEKITPTSLGYFVTLESPKVMAFLYRLDIFTVAAIVLMFLAARLTLRLKTSGAAACASVAVLILLVLPAVFGK